MGWLVFPSTPKDTLSPWLKTRDAHTHTRTHTLEREEKPYHTGQRLRSGETTEHTVFAFGDHNTSFFFYISAPISLTLPPCSSLSPSLLTKTSAACQGCKLLTPPFLVSKQVILFSIPVSAETVIICPLKRSHTLRRNAGKACQRNCWGWFGRENYKWPFTINTTSSSSTFLDFSLPLFPQNT